MFFTRCLVTKIKKWQGPQLDRFLITLCTKKYIFRRSIGMYKGFQSKDHMGRNNQHEMREYSEYIFGKFACGIEKRIFFLSGEAYISTMIY